MKWKMRGRNYMEVGAERQKVKCDVVGKKSGTWKKECRK